MSSKRQQIIDKLKLMLEDIQTANEYNTDLGANIIPWKLNIFPEADLPGATWRDSDAQADKPDKNMHIHTINIEFTAFVTGSTSPAQARQIIEDVHKAIGKNPLFDGLALRTVPGKNIINIDQDNKILAGININFSIVYTTKEWEM